MNISVIRRLDESFPVGLLVHERHKNIQKFTMKAAKQLRRELDEAIEWAVNMQDLRDEERKRKGTVKP